MSIFSQTARQKLPSTSSTSILWLLITLGCLTMTAVQAQNQVITEQTLYSNIQQGDKSFKFYTMQVSQRYFTGSQSLAFKVVSEGYDSDPDIFISKINTQPKSSSESTWYCMKAGSDTCIVKRTDINIGDNFNIGVRCMNPCQYSLRAVYAPIISLSEATRTQVRFDGYSTNIFEYFVPSDAKTGSTLGTTVMVESENAYNPIDMYFSTDDDLYQIEEKKQGQIIQNGKAYFFNSDDYDWCTKCYVYILVDVIEPGRYYITGTASARNDVLTTTTASQRIINARSQECYQYFIQKTENDLQVQIFQYQGDAEAYLSPRNVPSGPSDTTNIKLTAERSATRSLIATSKDRARYGYQTGLYYICLYGYIDTSAQLIISETNYNYRYDAVDDMAYTLRLENNGSVYYRYTTSDFAVRNIINLKLNTYNLNSTDAPPKIFYKVCPSQQASDCYLDSNEMQGRGASMIEVANGTVSGQTTRVGVINHDPSVCVNVNSCFYLIALYYPNSNGPVKVSFKINHDTQSPTDAQIGQSYRNIKRQSTYEYYQLLPGSSDGFPYSDSIVLDLTSYMGDAEVYVSTTNKFPHAGNYTWRSVEYGDTKDRIVLNRTAFFSLNVPIYVSIFAYTQVAYQLDISATYLPTYNSILEKAIPLVDGVGYFQNYSTEYQEGFFSFTPWWAAKENRTIVFAGDVFYNQIFFYMQRNDYPMFYMTDYKDQGDVIALYGGDQGYDRNSKYYIRVRPDFALYDLISTKSYLFNFYAFSQLPSNQFQDLQHNEKVMGYANGTQQFYRYLQLNKTSTIVVTVNPIQGNPRLLVKVANSPTFTNSSNVFSYDYKSDNPGTSTEQLNITATQRLRNSADCDFSTYASNGGNKICNLYIGVECPGQCVYNITLTVQGKENATTTFQPPRYLTEHNFYNGAVKYNETKFFYYPIHANNTGEMAIFLNKTGPLNTNGDVMLLVNLQNDTTLPYESWQYPTLSKSHIVSYSNSSTQPELIEICSQTFAARCQNSSCALIIGVMGISKTQNSNYRLNVYKQSTKLQNKVPVSGTIETAGSYHFYWFVNNITVTKPNATWEYIVASSTFNKSQDVDLYVSAMDGRQPSSTDNDWFSDNIGPDDVHITQADKMFNMKNWNTSNGILFIVGVKALTDNATYSLMMSGPARFNASFFDLNTSIIIQKTFNNYTGNNTHHYRWFNWGHRDFRIQVDGLVGTVYFMFNYMSEETYTNNGFLALPVNGNNSRYIAQVNATQSNQLKVYKTDIDSGFFCYYCWYYVTIMQNNTNQNGSYRISVSEIADAGDDIPQITVGDPNSLQLPATGSVAQRKFLLDTKNPFTIQVTLATGYAIVYVGLYPDAPLTKYAWKSEGGIGTITMRVRTTDPNFHIGTYYYVTMQATQGRATISLKVSQNKEISQLDNYISKKDLFWTNEERVKLYFFRAPLSNFTAKINIDALTEDFYPTMYVQKNNMTAKPADFRTLQYPNVKNYSYVMGDNFTTLANQHKMSYQFNDRAVTNFTYYTIALYDYSYGMTDRRKAEFRISLEIINTGTNTSNASTVIVSETQTPQSVMAEPTLYEKINAWFQATGEAINHMFNQIVQAS